ncbi:hypothetical protein DEAC_c43840 [Desulfosporosinus acididurans]|uniref:Helix-turn-helix domain protein n=1 Tax=Desulfosporosinus acididurans TaxID=476652 RepID=A0A0J1FL93_9FIRM|nr:helix-turn-helix domain-containing protein [Desulfosporosinus acididurans]KLU63698.1 hypothetical protein DEAC_c43840 [Desulfosporosinus acididurans]
MENEKSQPELSGLLFVMLGREALLDERLNKNDILVYVALCSFMDNVTRTLFPAIETIAKRARLSNRETIYCLKKLIKLEYLKKKRRPNQSNLYKITSKGFFSENDDEWEKTSGNAHHALPEVKNENNESGNAHHALPEVHTMHTNYTQYNYIGLDWSGLRFSEKEQGKIIKIAKSENAEPEVLKQVLIEFDRQDKSKIDNPLGWIRNKIREFKISSTLLSRPQTETPVETKCHQPLVVIVKDNKLKQTALFETDKLSTKKAKKDKYENFYL